MKTSIFIRSIGALLLTGGVLCSCSDMLDTPTTTHRYDNGTNLSNAADSLYSAMGILTRIQELGERYVLFGELRGDMMTVTPEADFSLREISEFQISPDNAYLSASDYYDVINNCNYALTRMATDITIHSDRVMMREYTAIRTMRAWTYLQMALAYGSVRYFDQPLLSLEAAETDYPELTLDALVPRLMSELEEVVGEELPDYGSVDGLTSRTFFMSPRLLLADLCLYSNEYDRAAQLYYDYIADTRLTLSYTGGNRWTSSSQDDAIVANDLTYTSEVISTIPYSSDAADIHPDLINLTYNPRPSLLAADWWVSEMNSISYFQADNLGVNTISGYLQGDLRGQMVFRGGEKVRPSAFGPGNFTSVRGEMRIWKYYLNGMQASNITSLVNPEIEPAIVRQVPVCRTPHVYLRLAEAANRAGKPSFAFAILKNGLSRDVMTDEVTINPDELKDGAEWTNFAVLALENYGSATRGRGLGVRLPGSDYVIPELPTRADSIVYVEDEILREMAAETAFEGNRFFDLLRVARHRNSPAFLADRVSARSSDPATLRARLLDQNNWWIK